MTEKNRSAIVIFITGVTKLSPHPGQYDTELKRDESMAATIQKKKTKRFAVGPICTDPYPPHLHEVVEIVILQRGYLNMTVNGIPYLLQPNDAVTIFPGMTHSYAGASEDAAGLFVGFLPEVIDEYYTAMISRWPVNPVQRIREDDRELNEAIRKLNEFSADGASHPLVPAYIHVLVACLFANLELVPAEDLYKNSFMYKVMQYVQTHAKESLTLDSVAEAMGVSRSHLSHLFSQQLKINFRKFLNTIRIENACLMLQEKEKSVKEICFACGFESTRTFHRAFLEEQRMTPGEYRERISSGIIPAEDPEESQADGD